MDEIRFDGTPCRWCCFLDVRVSRCATRNGLFVSDLCERCLVLEMTFSSACRDQFIINPECTSTDLGSTYDFYFPIVEYCAHCFGIAVVARNGFAEERSNALKLRCRTQLRTKSLLLPLRCGCFHCSILLPKEGVHSSSKLHHTYARVGNVCPPQKVPPGERWRAQCGGSV